MDDITNQEEKNPLEDRVKNLVNDKKLAEENFAKAESERQAAIKERDFYQSFSDSIAKFPSAPEFKDKIKEKVMAGYSVEDATVAILHSEGKLTPQVQKTDTVAGGSASNQITQPDVKTPQQMSSSDRWNALKEAEQRGELGMS